MQWTVNGELLGQGPTLAKAYLPVGENEIKLTGRNSYNLTGSATGKVFIDDNLDCPGPILSVGPEHLGWHVGNRTREQQQANLTIANAGGGSFTWQISEDADWLSLRGQGDLPATVEVTADPRGLPDDAVATATIRVTADLLDQPDQVIEIPVTLSKGFVLSGESDGESLYATFMPVALFAGR